MNPIREEWTSPDGSVRLILGDCLEILGTLPDASISLVATDPPYHRVKMDEEWDRQWKTDADYLAWLGTVLDEFRRVLKPNGSLYLFASPQMAWGVEGEVRKRFKVLQRITWGKPEFSTKAEMNPKEWQRQFFPVSEAIIFAEQFGTDETADGQAGYTTACEATKRGIFGDYLRSEFERANVTQRQIAALFPSATGGLTGCVSNWLLGYNCPTPEQYQRMRDFLNEGGDGHLRREYEYLRREYADLRRPFVVTAADAYTDVWTFPTVGDYSGKHPCEKPADMIRQIVRASSKPGDIVLDCFCGSGVTGQVCEELGRQAILVDQDEHWYRQSKRRVQGMNPTPRPRAERELARFPLFEPKQPKQKEFFQTGVDRPRNHE